MGDKTTLLIPAPPEPLPALPKELGQVQLSKLAREVAMDIRDLAQVLADYNLTEAQYAVIREAPYFKKALEIFLQEWNSASNTAERARVSAGALLEQALPTVGARASDLKEDLNKAVEACKLLAKVASIGERDQPVGNAEKFSITINLGADVQGQKVIVAEAGEAPLAIEAPKEP